MFENKNNRKDERRKKSLKQITFSIKKNNHKLLFTNMLD